MSDASAVVEQSSKTPAPVFERDQGCCAGARCRRRGRGRRRCRWRCCPRSSRCAAAPCRRSPQCRARRGGARGRLPIVLPESVTLLSVVSAAAQMPPPIPSSPWGGKATLRPSRSGFQRGSSFLEQQRAAGDDRDGAAHAAVSVRKCRRSRSVSSEGRTPDRRRAGRQNRSAVAARAGRVTRRPNVASAREVGIEDGQVGCQRRAGHRVDRAPLPPGNPLSHHRCRSRPAVDEPAGDEDRIAVVVDAAAVGIVIQGRAAVAEGDAGDDRRAWAVIRITRRSPVPLCRSLPRR